MARLMANINLVSISALSRTGVARRPQEVPGQGHELARQQNLSEVLRGRNRQGPGNVIGR